MKVKVKGRGGEARRGEAVLLEFVEEHEQGALVASFILGLPTACWLSKTMDLVQRAFSCAFSFLAHDYHPY